MIQEKAWLEEKIRFLGEFTTPPTGSQQVRILLKQNTRQMQDSHSSPVSERSSAGCVYHEQVMKSNTDSLPPSLSSLRWPCCDGAKRSEEHRQFRRTAGLIFNPLHYDPGLISSDATIRLSAMTETIVTQCWSLGPWTLERQFQTDFYTSMSSVVGVCVCPFVCVNVERGSLQRRGPKTFFLWFYYEDGNSQHWPFKLPTFSVIMNITVSALIKILHV